MSNGFVVGGLGEGLELRPITPSSASRSRSTMTNSSFSSSSPSWDEPNMADRSIAYAKHKTHIILATETIKNNHCISFENFIASSNGNFDEPLFARILYSRHEDDPLFALRVLVVLVELEDFN